MFSKKQILAVALGLLSGKAYAQPTTRADQLLHTLDSARHSAGISHYFASIYFYTTINATQFFGGADPPVQQAMLRMEERFATYFLDAAKACNEGTAIAREWNAYYAHPDASPLQLLLLGINAHVNGDSWKALVTEFSAGELEQLKPHYFSYYKGLLAIYDQVYANALANSRRLRLLHVLSLGLDKSYGKILLKRWRNRQMKLAELYYHSPRRHRRQLERLSHKMGRLNRLIRRNT